MNRKYNDIATITGPSAIARDRFRMLPGFVWELKKLRIDR